MILYKGFKLFQPWANEVVKGRLTHLVRSFSTINKSRVAVVATNKVDRIWLTNLSNKDISKTKMKIGAIGSVKIVNCIEVNLDNIKDKLIELAGNKYWRYFK